MLCWARQQREVGAWLPGRGAGSDRRGSWAVRRAPRSLAGSLQVTVGAWVRFQGDGRPRESLFMPGFQGRLTPASSILLFLPNSEIGQSRAPWEPSSQAPGQPLPPQGEKSPCANLGFTLRAQPSH